eukprot:CAMPEP_0119039160 /NCGR_PEP_ID=MMETSP1177-20130426/8520_1 /TAXON_ID=2985 /ORGANISM="Ochromonas sp, Strain CCMP1899" /LENGTH=236 /DNA_ID=CAMNT_0007002707 /DNA_START=167 /DNA_END=877 /DNA_ORIENTATION=+
MPPALKLGGAFLVGLASATIFWNTGRLYETVDSIPKQYFKEQKTITGEVVKINDGDTFRMRHIPGFWANSDFKGALKDHTLVVRIYAVDTPETPKFGNSGQPYGEDASKFAEKTLLNKKISVKLLSKDRYGRIIGVVNYHKDGFLGVKGKEADISEELVKEGLAVVYRQGGAQYDGSIQRWDKLELMAKKQKIGIWSQQKVQLPSEYKKETKEKVVLKPSKRGIKRYQEAAVVDAI